MKYQNSPLWDETKSLDARLDYLIKELTIDEKLHMLSTQVPVIPRLGLREDMSVGGEAAHGVQARNDQSGEEGRKPTKTTAFTQPIGLSQTFDEDLLLRVGRAVGYETRALYNMGQGGLSRWAPTVDMERDPRWGRNEEGYGEDPLLTGKMASAYIRGMKGDDKFYILAGATLKHFYGNNVEEARNATSSSIDARNKLEYYLEPFRRCVMEGGACGLMTAYNAINGLPCNLNYELQTYLRDEWGFDGHVVTDADDLKGTVNAHHYLDNVEDALVASIKAGVDCQTDRPEDVYQIAKSAYEAGKLTEEMMDTAIRHAYGTKIRLGMFDPFGATPYSGVKPAVVDCEIHRRLALEVQEKACVLLKNDDNFFPIDKNKKVALIGTWADNWYNDWYGALPPRKITILQGLKKSVKNIVVDNGYDKIILGHDGKFFAIKDKQVVLTDNKADAAVLSVNDWGNGHMFITDEEGNHLAADNSTMIVKGKDAFDWFVREDLDLRDIGNGQVTIKSWNGNRVYVENGELKVNDKEGPWFYVKPAPVGEEDYNAGPEFKFTIEYISRGTDRVKELCKDVDVVLACVGCNPVVNARECIDRDDLEFIPAQKALIAAAASVNENLGMILISNYPYYIEDELEVSKGVLLSASGNEELGNGIANVLLGKVSPAGKLNQTWYGRDTILPNKNYYDIRATKRTYMYFDEEPLFAFGHGLTYTSFRYDKMRFAPENGVPVFTVDVTNTGKVASDEVIQLYVAADGLRVAQPIKRLVGFKRVNFKPGERKTIKFVIPKDELTYYDVIREKKVTETGIYEFFVGNASDSIKASSMCAINGLEPAERIAYKKITAYRYDEYYNCYLNNTKDKVKFMQSLEGGEFGAEYRDITYEVAPKGIKISYVCLDKNAKPEDMSMKLYFADELLIDEVFDSCDDKDKVVTKEFLINNLNMVGMENINHTVSVDCGQAIGLVSFVFV